jgi:hypothetical protein
MDFGASRISAGRLILVVVINRIRYHTLFGGSVHKMRSVLIRATNQALQSSGRSLLRQQPPGAAAANDVDERPDAFRPALSGMWDSRVGQHSSCQGEWQADDVGVVAADPLDE